MFEWVTSLFSGVMAELTFLGICIGSAVITTFSLIFGGDHDADHGDVDGHDVDHSHEGPGFFSVRGITLFGTGFGGVGYIVQHFTGRTLTASASGFAAGIALAGLGIMFIRAFFHQQASSLLPSEAVVGAVGTVTISIPPDGGVGEVGLSVAGIHTTRPATSVTGAAIDQGKAVRVTRTAGHMVVVERVVS